MNLAIIGATGNVGRKTIEILEKSKIKISKLFLVASEKSEGKKINYEGATGVEFDKIGDTFGSFVEVDFNKGKLKIKKLR